MNINRLNLKVLDIIIGKFSASSFSQSLRLSKDTIKVVLPESNEPNACSDVKSAQVSFSYTVPDTLCRRVNGMLQPILSTAAALAVLDEVSTYSFILKDRTCRGGVSVHLTTEMLSPCVAGESVVIHTRLRKLGKTLGFCDFEMVSADKSKSGQVIARGQHIKHLPLGGAWDAIASPTLLPLVLRLHDLLFDGNNNAPTTPWARWFTRWAFGGVNSSDLKQVSGEGGVFKAVALQPVGRGAKGSVVNRFESTPAMNNVLGKLHGGAVAVALETAALTSYRIFHDEQQTHADLGARQTLSHPDDVFLSSMSVRYLDALKGKLDISCQMDREALCSQGRGVTPKVIGFMGTAVKNKVSPATDATNASTSIDSNRSCVEPSHSVQFQCSWIPVAKLREPMHREKS